MTNKEIVTQLQGVIAALNQISCSGMENHLNLGGSLSILRNLIVQLNNSMAEKENPQQEA